MTPGERIKMSREKVGITQVELGETIGVSGVAIMRYERNQRQPRLEQFQALAAALGVDVNWLMNGRTLEQRDQAMKDYVSQRFAETELNKRLEDSYCSLTLGGKVKAVESVEIIAGNPLYQAQQSEEAPSEAAESTSPTPEAKDTAPAPEDAETPPEGK